MKTIDELRTLVEKVISDEADYDTVIAELNEQITAYPASIDLLKLRLSLHEAAYDRGAMWQDRKLLLALQPDDLDLALDIALSQHHWSRMFAEQECSAQLEAAGAYRLDDADEAEALAIQSSPAFIAAAELVVKREEALQAEAISSYHALMQRHAHDPVQAQKIFAFWDRTVFRNPWQAYLLLNTAMQALPHAVAYRKREALYLASLAREEEEGLTKVPTGYFVDHVLGNLHARTVYDALDAIAAIEAHEQDDELVEARAELQQALANYPAAAASYRLVADLCEKALKNTSEEEQRAALQRRMDDMRQSADNCDGGSRTLQENRITTMGGALTRLQSSLGAFQDRLQQRFGANYQPTGKPDFSEAMSSLQGWQGRIDQLVAPPTEENKATLREKAASIAARTVGLVRFGPVILSPMSRSDFTMELPTWFDEVDAALREDKLEFAGWFQNLQSVEALKHEAPGQLWLAPDHSFELTAEAGSKSKLKRCMTELSDGTILITADARGSGWYSSGPKVDSFNVFKSTPIHELVAVHRARLAVKLARHPELKVVPIDGLARSQQVEQLLKNLANEFRMQYGIVDSEIRAMNVKHHAFFAEELKREVAERIKGVVAPT